MKNSNDTIGNQTCDLLACSAVPQPTFVGWVTKYELTYLLTYSMVQSPSWEANWFAASQEIARILWNLKVHYCLLNMNNTNKFFQGISCLKF